MALVKSGKFGSSPSAYYEIHADLLGGSGNTRQVKVHLALKVDGGGSSRYGYPLQWYPVIHQSSPSWQHVKGNEMWYGTDGLRWYSWTHTIDVGTSSSTNINLGFDLRRADGGSTSWNTSQRGSFNVGSTNVPPTISGTVNTNPSGTIPENTGSIYVESPTAQDANGNLSGYRCQVSVNDGGWSEVYRGSSRGFNHNTSSYGEGTKLRYRFDAYDSNGAYTKDWVYSGFITKNTLTPDTVNSSSSIAFNTDKVVFTNSGATNTNGNTSFTKILSCEGITVYNGTNANFGDVKIHKSGTTPSGCYILFDQIKNKFQGSNYKGNLNFTLTTKNAYGTSKSTSKSISVNLQTDPNNVSGFQISTSASESTAYKNVAFATGNYYFLPDGTSNRVVRVKWSGGSGKLGETISFDLYVAYGSGGYTKLATLNQGTTYYNHTISKQTVSQSFKYKIITKTNYGTSVEAISSAQTLHFYNTPSLSTGTITRGATTCDVVVTVKSVSSIPNIGTVGTWQRFAKGTTSPVQQNGSLNPTQNAQTIRLTGLTDSGQYDLKIVYKDNTGFSSDIATTISIGANSPIMFVNKYGVGVNGTKATANFAFAVSGETSIGDRMKFKSSNGSEVNIDNFTDDLIFSNRGGTVGGTMPSGGHNGKAFLHFNTHVGKYFTQLGLNTNTNNLHIRSKDASDTWGSWRTFYHTGFKPTWQDVGAIQAGNWRTNGGQDLLVHGKRALVGTSGGQLYLGYGGDFTDIRCGNNHKVYHEGHKPDWNGEIKNRPVVVEWQYNGASVNLNSFTKTCQAGVYQGSNFPPSGATIGVLEVSRYSDDWLVQQFRYCDSAGTTFRRSWTNGNTWNGWVRQIIADRNDVYGFRHAGHYMHCNVSDGAKGVDWWASDLKLKENISSLDDKGKFVKTIDKKKISKTRLANKERNNGLEIISKIEHFSFTQKHYKAEDENCKCGYIAQQLENINPDFIMKVEQPEELESVSEDGKAIKIKNPNYSEDDIYIRQPRPSAIIPYITKAIQEQQIIISEKDLEIEELKNRLKAIEEKLGII